MAPNYANGKIYCLRNRKDNDRIVYVGSTVRPLSERMAEHRSEAKCQKHCALHKKMDEVGIEHFHIELVVDFPCERREQLLAEEGRHIRLQKNAENVLFNYQIAGRSRIEKNREYYARPEVKDRQSEMQKVHVQIPEVKERRKEYYRQPDMVAQRKAHREIPEVKELIKEKKRAYYLRKKAERIALVDQ